VKTSLIVADDFIPGPDMLRRRALLSDFQTREFQGVNYKGVGVTNQPHDMEERIGRLLGAPVKIDGSFYRTGSIGNDPTTYIHADRNCAEYAGVLYLNTPEQCHGGTAFWRHRESHLEELPSASSEDFYAKLNRNGQHEDFWEMVGLVSMKFNRFVCYPSKLFHSRYPKDCWGDTLETGRLIHTVFFNLR